MKKSIQVYIPTSDRVGRQTTLEQFQLFSSHYPILVCPKGEKKEHEYDKVIECPLDGIGNTRQWILDNSKSDIVIMVDDDMKFFERVSVNDWHLDPCDNLDNLLELIRMFVSRGFIHGGVGARQGNNRIEGKVIASKFGNCLVQDCTRVNNFHFVDRKKVLSIGARMDSLPVMEDFHFTLYLLTKGFPNRVIQSYVWNQRASGDKGGCSNYRTPEVQSSGANGLKKSFPDFVTVVKKKTKVAWKEFNGRDDVRVQWKKAAKKGGIKV